MRVIRAPSIGRAHELVVKMILEKGWVLRTEDDEATIEFEEVAMQVDTPLAAPMTSPHSRFQQKFVDQYARDLIEGSKASFEYDYHGRLFDWGERLITEGQPVHVDQIAYIVDKLKKFPESRRAIAITWNPVIDEQLDDCPCLQLVQCVLRNGSPVVPQQTICRAVTKLHDDTVSSSCKLHMRVVFRSNDMLTAAGANMYALVRLQNHIAGRLGVPCGSYTHISLVPHIYYLRDIPTDTLSRNYICRTVTKLHDDTVTP
ncbi:MAG: thymidylate synthase [Methanoregula sp.]|nr:thymidylate synthase [Methanoregula sp.]